VLREMKPGLTAQRHQTLVALADDQDARATRARSGGELPDPLGGSVLLLIARDPLLARPERLLARLQLLLLLVQLRRQRLQLLLLLLQTLELLQLLLLILEPLLVARIELPDGGQVLLLPFAKRGVEALGGALGTGKRRASRLGLQLQVLQPGLE